MLARVRRTGEDLEEPGAKARTIESYPEPLMEPSKSTRIIRYLGNCVTTDETVSTSKDTDKRRNLPGVQNSKTVMIIIIILIMYKQSHVKMEHLGHISSEGYVLVMTIQRFIFFVRRMGKLKRSVVNETQSYSLSGRVIHGR